MATAIVFRRALDVQGGESHFAEVVLARVGRGELLNGAGCVAPRGCLEICTGSSIARAEG